MSPDPPPCSTRSSEYSRLSDHSSLCFRAISALFAACSLRTRGKQCGIGLRRKHGRNGDFHFSILRKKEHPKTPIFRPYTRPQTLGCTHHARSHKYTINTLPGGGGYGGGGGGDRESFGSFSGGRGGGNHGGGNHGGGNHGGGNQGGGNQGGGNQGGGNQGGGNQGGGNQGGSNPMAMMENMASMMANPQMMQMMTMMMGVAGAMASTGGAYVCVRVCVSVPSELVSAPVRACECWLGSLRLVGVCWILFVPRFDPVSVGTAC